MLIAQSPLISWVLNVAAADLNGKVSAGGISLGWFSPIRMSQVAVHDRQGQLILDVPQASSSRTLASLLLNPSNLGRFRVERPNLVLVLRPDGSNLEDLIAKLETTGGGAIDVGLDIADGTVSVLDTATQRQWQIDNLQGKVTLPADQQKPLDVTSSGTIDDSGRAGRFQIELAMRQKGYRQGDGPPMPNSLKLTATDVPLDMFQSPLGRLLANPIRVSGRLASTVEGTWDVSSQGASFRMKAGATASELHLACSGLGTDVVQLAKLDVNAQAALQDSRLQIDQLTVQTDLGKVQATGSLEAGNSTGALLASLPQQTYHVQGQLDVARLTAMLPATLRLQQDTQIISGLLEMNVDSRRGPQGMLWQGQLTSTKLQAVSGARAIVWEKPIQLAFNARQTDQGPVVENLMCESSFLKASGSGTPDQLTATATLSLDRLVEDLRGLIDLGQLRLSGTGWTQLSWKRTPQQTFRADGQAQLRNFEFSLPDRPAWKEEGLNAWLVATGKTDFTANTRLDTALLRAETGSDQFEAQLVQPVADFHGGGIWPVRIRAQGQLDRWRPRLAPWVDLNNCQFAGSHQLLVQITGSAEQIQLHRAQLIVDQLAVSGPSVRIEEPRVDLTAAGTWKWSDRRAELPQVSISSQSLSAQLSETVLSLPQGGAPEIAGSLHAQADLNRIQQWIAATGAALPAWRLYGLLSTDLQVQQAQGKTTGKLDAAVQNLAAVHSSGNTIRQEAIRIGGHGEYDQARGVVHLKRAALAAPAAKLEMGGDIAFTQQPPRFDLEGKIQYDLAPISELLQALLGTSIRISGRGAGPIAYHGSLDPATAEGNAAVQWKSAELYGFRIGPGNLQASMAGGTVNFRPLDLDVNEGKVHLAPQIQCTSQASTLTLQPGRLAEQVRINPAMCMSALKYVAPALAGVASAEGLFSIELDNLRIPLTEPARGQAAGRMIVHSVRVGPGPLVQELALALGYTSPAQIAKESKIDFQLADGRIYHRGVELTFPDVTVRTQGSVGFDKSLALVAEMPVPPKWQGNKAVAAATRDQAIRLPIGGTLDRPKVDGRALEQIARQFLHGAAENLLQDQLNKQLNRLFNPPQR
jgi:hypothetical protein